MSGIIDILKFITDIAGQATQIPSLGLILLVIAIFAEILLAIAVIRSNYRSATNIIYLSLSVTTIFWLVASYIVGLPQFSADVLVLARLGIFFAAPMSWLFFLLADTFPSPTLRLKRSWFWLTCAGTALMMALNISPYAFTDTTKVVNGAIHPAPGWGLAPFAVLSTIFSILAIYLLVRRYRASSGVEREQTKIVFMGMLIMLGFLTFTVLIPILVFASGFFVLFVPLYTLIFLGMTAYAIVKYGLFDLKVIATEALTIMIWITLFANIFAAGDVAGAVTGFLVFLATLALGILLIKSVRQEVAEREQLDQLSRFKSELLSLASHQIRSPLAAIKGFVSLIQDGSYGPIDDRAKEALRKVQQSTDDLIALINTLLDVRKVEEGKMEYKFEPADLVQIVTDVFELLRPLADAKKLEFTLGAPEGKLFADVDAEKFKQVVQNLVDNAIKYTPSGFVRVVMERDGGMAVISISDSGVGIPGSLIPYLFEEFMRDERVKKEIRGTGLGLFIARKITEAHGGTIQVRSPGEGQGSTFTIMLPLISEPAPIPVP